MENSIKKPELIKGGFAVDERGTVSFVNDFDFHEVKRFYIAENMSTDVIRAFHGHMKEAKYISVIEGAAIVIAVPIDNSEKPSKDVEIERFVLSAASPSVLYVPGGYANGFRALDKNTKVIFFSNTSLEDSQEDSFRFAFDYWGADIWKSKNF